jgi:hypothetical protein
MRRTERTTSPALLATLAAVLALVTACAASSPRASDLSIECQVFYRPAPDKQFSETIVTLGPGNASRSLSYDRLEITVQLTDDLGEGTSLSIAVTDLEAGGEIGRQLYQIDRAKGLTNQFVGGHGFTGLHYVHQPGSTGELQYFCLAK